MKWSVKIQMIWENNGYQTKHDEVICENIDDLRE